MVGAISGPDVLRSPCRVLLRSWLHSGQVRKYTVYGHGTNTAAARETAVATARDVALTAAGGGADGAAHAQFGGGLRLWLRIRFWLGPVVVGGPALGLPVPVSAGVVARGLGLTLLLTLFQPET